MKKQNLFILFRNEVFTTEVFVKTITAMALLFLYALGFSRILPQGINNVFAIRLYPRILVMMVMLFFGFFAFFHFTKQKSFKYVNPVENFHAGDLFLLLFPMTPVTRYIVLNQDVLTLFDSAAIFIIFLAVSFVLTFLIPIIIGIIGSKKVLMITGLSFSYMLFNMASLAADSRWHLSGNLKVQIIVLALILTVFLVVYSLDKKFLYFAVIMFFALITLVSLVLTGENKDKIKEALFSKDKPKIYAYTKGKELKRAPDVFLLTYDAYAQSETMYKYGIDNSAQKEYLLKSGFHIYKGIYSLGAASKTSMDSILNVQKNGDYRNYNRGSTSGNGAVQNILKENGYETFGIFPSNYFFQKEGTYYEHSYPKQADALLNQSYASYKLFAKSIFEGEFRFDAGYFVAPHSEFILKKREVLALRADRPKFLYSHTDYPGHSQNSGKALGNEIEVYKDKVAKANEEMRLDIEVLKEHNPGAIIIINGDHGPYLTKNCTRTDHNNDYDKSEINRLDIQDRFGTFLAIKWPEGANIDHDKIEILQDIFPSVFSYLYEDASILNSRIEQLTQDAGSISGVRVRRGIIEGGINDGEFLFDSMEKKR